MLIIWQDSANFKTVKKYNQPILASLISMDCTDIQRDYHNNVRLIFMSRNGDQNFRQQKPQLFWEKNLTQKFPRTLLNARAMAVGVLRLHMSVTTCQKKEKRWWWDGGEEMGYTSVFLSYKSSTSTHIYSLHWHYCIYSNIQTAHIKTPLVLMGYELSL